MNFTYLDVRNNVVEQIKKVFKNDKRLTLDSHPGRFDEGEIRRLMQHTPAILTSLMGISDNDVEDESNIDFVSWVLYRADNKDRLYDGALSLVSALIGIIKNINTPVSFGGGTHINAECLYSGSLDKINATLWAVRWKLNVRGVNNEGNILLPDDLDWFKGYESTLEVGTQKADDIVNLD